MLSQNSITKVPGQPHSKPTVSSCKDQLHFRSDCRLGRFFSGVGEVCCFANLHFKMLEPQDEITLADTAIPE